MIQPLAGKKADDTAVTQPLTPSIQDTASSVLEDLRGTGGRLELISGSFSISRLNTGKPFPLWALTR